MPGLEERAMAGCTSGCQFKAGVASERRPAAALAAATVAAVCMIGAVPCPAESHSRACLPGDPGLSSLQIQRLALDQALWSRTLTAVAPAGTPAAITEMVLIFPAFVASGKPCLKSVSLSFTVPGVPPVTTVVAVEAVGISGVWDMADTPGGPIWTARVGTVCLKEVLGINTTTGRCPCEVACKDCIYPAAVGGLFAVRLRFPSTAVVAGTDTISVTVTGTFEATPPCCLIPLSVGEPAVVAGPYPAFQSLAA
jgi:hypothetical protein